MAQPKNNDVFSAMQNELEAAKSLVAAIQGLSPEAQLVFLEQRHKENMADKKKEVVGRILGVVLVLGLFAIFSFSSPNSTTLIAMTGVFLAISTVLLVFLHGKEGKSEWAKAFFGMLRRKDDK